MPKFRTRLGFKQYDVTLTKEQQVLTKIKSSFGGENTQIQYSVTKAMIANILSNIFPYQ